MIDFIIENNTLLSFEVTLQYDKDLEIFEDDNDICFQSYLSRELLKNNADIIKESPDYYYFKNTQKNLDLFYEIIEKEETKKTLSKILNYKFPKYNFNISQVDPVMEEFSVRGNHFQKGKFYIILENESSLNIVDKYKDLKKIIIDKLNLGIDTNSRNVMRRECYATYKIKLISKERINIESEISIERKLTVNEINSLTQIKDSIYHVTTKSENTRIKGNNIMLLKEIQNG